MKKNILRVLLFLLYPLLLYPQWVPDPTNNLAVCTVEQTQRETRLCNDGDGNVFVFWRDYRNEPTIFGGDIYVQKLDAKGIGLWTQNGKAIVTGFGGQFDPKVISDGEQGIYLVWRTTPNSFQDYSLHANRIDNNGNKLWGSSDVNIQSGLGTTILPSTIMNEDGDLLITWQLVHAPAGTVHIYIQKVDRNGNIKWGSNGLLVCLNTGLSSWGPKIISDGKGGAFVCWSDNRSGGDNSDIYAQRISSGGTLLWTANGIPICTKAASQNVKHIISDNNGGALIFWEDIQTSSINLSAQKIDSTGNKLWEPDGRILYSSTSPFSQYEFVLDKNKEIFFFWSTSEGNIYVQKVNYDGNLIWSNSIPICATQSSVSYLAAYQSDVNGIVISWLDNRNANYDLYSQWISTDGIARWNADGVAVCNEVHEQSDYSITSDNFGGAVIAWADMRNGNFDVYAQNIDARGKLGTNRYHFQKSGLNKTITNLNPTEDTLSISLLSLEETGYFNVIVILDSIIHPAVDELTIKLTHLTKTDTIVYNLSSGENFINTVLDDYALNTLNNSSYPFTGMYKPYNPLSVFIGSDLNGEWVLALEDNNGANNGLLKSWGLVFNKGEITGVGNPSTKLFPENYYLFQNYPNPFNPRTKINWQSPVSGHQTIKVFDVLGNEIATIVDGYYEAGIHSTLYIVNSSLPSGVYFYQLKAGDPSTSSGQSYEQTRKMILLK